MNTPAQPAAETVVPQSVFAEDVDSFLRSATEALGLECAPTRGGLEVQLGEADRQAFDGKQSVLLADHDAAQKDAGLRTLRNHFFDWIVTRLREGGATVSALPAEQPESVHDVVPKLFSAYRVEGGQAHLGGCEFTEQPFLRLSFLGPEGRQLRHVFVSKDGSSVSDELVKALGLNELTYRPGHRPGRIDPVTIESLTSAGRRIAAKAASDRTPDATVPEPKLLTVVWAKRAEGQLRFTIGEETASHPFAGWARQIEAEPFVGPQSGKTGFHIAATDDGVIDVQAAIGRCEYSGRRVLRSELVVCAATGKNVLRQYTRVCPVSGQPCLDEEFSVCGSCQQEVSRPALEEGTCQACLSTKPVSKDDPRVVWVLGEHRGLDKWRQWRVAETEEVYIFRISGLLRRLLVVVDKESLTVRYMARAGAWGSRWTPVSEVEKAQLLS